MAERAWKDVNNIKSGTASHIKAEITEKQSIIYTTACVEEARVNAAAMKNTSSDRVVAWNDDDTTFDLQLENLVSILIH